MSSSLQVAFPQRLASHRGHFIVPKFGCKDTTFLLLFKKFVPCQPPSGSRMACRARCIYSIALVPEGVVPLSATLPMSLSVCLAGPDAPVPVRDLLGWFYLAVLQFSVVVWTILSGNVVPPCPLRGCSVVGPATDGGTPERRRSRYAGASEPLLFYRKRYRCQAEERKKGIVRGAEQMGRGWTIGQSARWRLSAIPRGAVCVLSASVCPLQKVFLCGWEKLCIFASLFIV